MNYFLAFLRMIFLFLGNPSLAFLSPQCSSFYDQSAKFLVKYSLRLQLHFLCISSSDTESEINSITPQFEPVAKISQVLSHKGSFFRLNICYISDMSCIANCSCLTSSLAFIIALIRFQDLRCPKIDYFLILSFCAPDNSLINIFYYIFGTFFLFGEAFLKFLEVVI